MTITNPKRFLASSKIASALILIFLATATSCKKKDAVDYRDQFVGEYALTYHYEFWQMGVMTWDTTVHYNGHVGYGDVGNITMDWYDGEVKEFTVSSSGTLTKCGAQIGAMTTAQFDLSHDDDLCTSGPLGANYYITVHGDKN